jgi:hypothetical protein
LRNRYEVEANQEIKRLGIIANEETEECIVELYLRQILIFPLQNSMFKFDVPKTILISRRETLAELEKKIQRVLNKRLYERQERGFMVSKIRLWRTSAALKIEELPEIEKKAKSYTSVKFDGTCINFKNDAQKANIYVEELPISQGGSIEEEDMLIIELPKSKDTFVLVPLSGPI